MKLRSLFAFFFCLFLFTPNVFAQAGGLRGRVADPNGAYVPGATVTLVSQGGAARRTAVTDGNGVYEFTQIAPGAYNLQVEKSGFKTESRENLRVAGESPLTLDVTLEIGGLGFEQTVVVTASRSAEELKDAPASVSVVSGRDLQVRTAQMFTGYELVGLPSVYVPKYDEGTYTSLTIRGVPERHHNDTFLALLDGIPFVTPGDEIELEFIPIDIVQSVELVRGPMSALYGRGGVAGAVNYLTRDTPERSHATVRLGYGSYNYARPSFNFSVPLKRDRDYLFGSGYFEHKDGWRDRTQRNAGNFFLKNQWNINDRFALSTYANYHRYKQGVASHTPVREDGGLVEVTGGRTANYNLDGSAYAKEAWMTTASLNAVITPRLNLKTTGHYRQSHGFFLGGFNEGFNEMAGVISWNGFNGNSAYKTGYIESQLNWQGRRVRLVAGANYERISSRNLEDWTGEYGFNPATFEFLFYVQKRSYRTGAFTNRAAWVTDRLLDARADVDVTGSYAQATVDVTSKLFITAGARFDYFSRGVNYARTVSGGEVTPASFIEDSDHHVSPKLSVSYRLTPQVTGYVSFGEGFSPGFGPVWSFGGRNTNLKPEVARNYEGGVRGNLLDARLYLSATVYLLQRKDLILLVPEGTGTRTINVGKQQSRGFELESRYDLGRAVNGLSGYFNYSYTDSEWKNNRFALEFGEGVRDYTGKKVRGVPEHLFSVGLNKVFARGVAARGWLDFTGGVFADPENKFRSDAYGLLNASLTVPLPDERMEFQVITTNLTNKKYYYIAGYSIGPSEAYPGTPFQIFGSFKYRF